MSLSAGSRLGPYEILAPLGRGAMGEVYRGRDTRLNRNVALKILPDSFTGDPERVARFRREAHVLASLNHPHIGAIYGLEESGNRQFLVLELIDGETLAARLTNGALPVPEALAIAGQVAAALEAAHETGVVHRDLKPANIGLTREDQVKVLDFGLAKTTAPALAGSGDLANSPTLTSPALMTGVGMILGTAAYMSPEQAKGREADRRSDLWALGVVLYEMLTARSPFQEADVPSSLAAVLTRDPDWTALPKATPLGIRRLLGRCLERDRRRRLGDAGEAAFQIEQAAREPSGTVVETASASVQARAWLPWMVAGVLAIIGTAAALAWRFQGAVPTPLALEARIEIAPEGNIGPGVGGSPVAISPDGRVLAFVTEGRRLHVRRLDQLTATEVPESTGGAPFFSPDGQWIGFFGQGKLKKVPVAGGVPTDICAAEQPKGGTWTADGTIVFSPDWSSGLYVVPAEGGTPVPLTTLDASAGERSHRSPQALPGRRVVIFANQLAGDEWDDATIEAVSLDTKARTVLYRGGTYPRAQDGLLFLARRGALYAVPFDQAALTTSGTPRPVLSDLLMAGDEASGGEGGIAHYDLSRTGTLVARTGKPGTASAMAGSLMLRLIDAAGRRTFSADETNRWQSVWGFSPDGRRLLGTTADGYLSLFDTVTRGFTRLTFERASLGDAVWTPDGSAVVFVLLARADTGLYWMPVDGSRRPELLVRTGDAFTPSFSGDGRTLVFQVRHPVGAADVVTLRLDRPLGPGVKMTGPDAYAATDAEEAFSSFSPDGRWIAYARRARKEGRFQPTLKRFPPGEGLWQVSGFKTGRPMAWSPDGRRLIFWADGLIVSIPVDTSSGVPVFGEPTILLRSATSTTRHVAVSPDGRQFAVLEPLEGNAVRTGEAAGGSVDARHVLVSVGWADRVAHQLP